MDDSDNRFIMIKSKLSKDIASEIVLSKNPEDVIKKWRNIFKISQKTLAEELGITPSVVSDYESGRRKSPGVNIIRRYVNALLDIDTRRGGKVIRSFGGLMHRERLSSAIIDIKEFSIGIKIKDFCKRINVDMLTGYDPEEEIYGYTIIDSLKAITEFSYTELINVYGTTSQRALIFTKVSTGKTPMVALKLTNLRPALTILHGLNEVDEIAKRIAEVENIPLGVCRLEKIEDIIEKLSDLDH
jgi:putative transcriptional regulator